MTDWTGGPDPEWGEELDREFGPEDPDEDGRTPALEPSETT